jgi:DNA polymerase I-like protein with 3'-5' exonuclease and polymerase domains
MIYMAPRLVDINGRLLGTVHDEISVSAEERYFDYVKEIMHEAANALACDCPMLMDVGMGNNWAGAKP